jgi:4-carboxymuconolactone decarboxylase
MVTIFKISVNFIKENRMDNKSNDQRRVKGLSTLQEVTKLAGQNVVGGLQNEFPFLANSIIDFAYGEVISRKILDPKLRQVATVAALAADGALLPQLKVHFIGALNVGVTPEELIEVVYLLSVYSGFPKAINAANVLSEVFKEKDIKVNSNLS